MARLFGWHIAVTRVGSAGAGATEYAPEMPQGLTVDNAQAIADFATKTYADENARTKDLDGKAAPPIAATGAAILLVANTLVNLPAALSSGQGRAFFGGCVVAILLFVLAQLCFLRAIAVHTFYRVPIAEFTDPDAAVQDGSWLFWRMATRLERAVASQRGENDRKACPGRFVCPSALRGSLICVVEATEHREGPHVAHTSLYRLFHASAPCLAEGASHAARR